MKLKTKHLLIIAAVALVLFLLWHSNANTQAAGVASALNQVQG